MEPAFYKVILHLHSIVRWLLLAGLLTSVILAISGLSEKKGIGYTGRLFARTTVYFAHLQLLIGLVLFFISPRVIFNAASMRSPILRYFLVEHTSAMLLAIILITTGYIKMKKTAEEARSARTLLWFYIFSLIIILTLIPWPFTKYAGHYW